jgi:hypothetical protein
MVSELERFELQYINTCGGADVQLAGDANDRMAFTLEKHAIV